jgi:pseudouridine-5'-monophosphatase
MNRLNSYSGLPIAFMTFACVSMASIIYVRQKQKQTTRKEIGFIFDLDGTLLDFEGASHLALNAPLQKFNKTVDWKLHASICGKPAQAWSREILQALEITEISPDQYAHEWHEYIVKSFPTMKLLNGALEIVKKCKEKFPYAKLAIATSSERKNFDAKMAYHPKLIECFDSIVTGDEIKNGKPSPDIFIEAARRIGLHPKRCLVFEDSPAGALGGKRAGCLVVAIPDDRMVGNENAFSFADIVIKSLVQFDDGILQRVHDELQLK